MKSIGIAVIASLLVLAQPNNTVSTEHIREHDRFLSSDLLEGRAVGSRGGDLATEYIATQFALAGAKPAGDNGTYFQKVPLVGIDPQPSSQLSAAAGSNTVQFQWLD
ncbi:MAG: peptidase M28, partial [Terriglobia bacterium]